MDAETYLKECMEITEAEREEAKRFTRQKFEEMARAFQQISGGVEVEVRDNGCFLGELQIRRDFQRWSVQAKCECCGTLFTPDIMGADMKQNIGNVALRFAEHKSFCQPIPVQRAQAESLERIADALEKLERRVTEIWEHASGSITQACVSSTLEPEHEIYLQVSSMLEEERDDSHG